jgi:hypothetical protein
MFSELKVSFTLRPGEPSVENFRLCLIADLPNLCRASSSSMPSTVTGPESREGPPILGEYPSRDGPDVCAVDVKTCWVVGGPIEMSAEGDTVLPFSCRARTLLGPDLVWLPVGRGRELIHQYICFLPIFLRSPHRFGLALSRIIHAVDWLCLVHSEQIDRVAISQRVLRIRHGSPRG